MSAALTADMRPEFVVVCKVYGKVCEVVDPVYARVEQTVGMALPLIVNRYMGLLALIAFFPVMAFTIPFLILACTVGLPIFLPIAIVSLVLCFLNGLLIFGLLAISPPGRVRVIEPLVNGVLQEEVGKKLVYSSFPRPTLADLTQLAVPTTPWVQLVLCLFMDFVCGNASYLVPLLGESFDLIWAPCQGIMMAGMFDKLQPNAKYVGMLEEILPCTDIIPSATLTWLKVSFSLALTRAEARHSCARPLPRPIPLPLPACPVPSEPRLVKVARTRNTHRRTQTAGKARLRCLMPQLLARPPSNFDPVV